MGILGAAIDKKRVGIKVVTYLVLSGWLDNHGYLATVTMAMVIFTFVL